MPGVQPADAGSLVRRGGPPSQRPRSATANGATTLARRSRLSLVEDLSCYAFLAPYLVCFVLFAVIPIGFGFYVSLHHWSAVLGNTGFAGLSQYVHLFQANTLGAREFWAAMRHTVLFLLISVPLLWAVPTGLAYLVLLGPAKPFFRSVFFFPTVFSSTAVASLWLFLLATSGGPVNQLLHAHVPWLVAQPWAWVSIDVATVWWSMGFNLVIMYAGMTQIPASLFEAAEIDGAGRLRSFFSIALPSVRSVSLVVLVMATIASFNLFAQSYLMTGGGPGSSTQTLTMVIYDRGFSVLRMGSATAMAFVMGALLAVVAFVEYRIGAGGPAR